jgi:SPP1 family predicted phage head-tail adaptor
MIRAGSLRHQIALQAPAAAQAPDGQVNAVDAWTTYATAWASVEPLSGRELAEADQIRGVSQFRVRLRYSGIIRLRDRILWGPPPLTIIGASLTDPCVLDFGGSPHRLQARQRIVLGGFDGAWSGVNGAHDVTAVPDPTHAAIDLDSSGLPALSDEAEGAFSSAFSSAFAVAEDAGPAAADARRALSISSINNVGERNIEYEIMAREESS